MIISIGSDHGGFLLKDGIVKYLKEKGIIVKDHGTFDTNSVHYPEYAKMVCDDYVNHNCDFGILVCTTGVGMCIFANKVKGCRAVVARCTEEAMLSRNHNNCNILCLGAKFTTLEDAKKIIDTFLETPFAGGRHQIRVNMIIEQEDK